MPDLYVGLVAAGPRTGLGHVVRTSAVLEALARRGKEVCLLVEERESPFELQHYPFDEGGLPIKTCSEGEMLKTVEALTSEIPGGCTLLTDVPEAAAFDFEMARARGCEYMVCLNAYEPEALGADLAFLRGYSWESGKELPSNVRTGAKFESVARRVRCLRPPEPWSGEAVQSVLVTLGAADPGMLTEDVAREAALLFDEVGVVVGPLFDSDREGALEALTREGVKLYHAPNNLPSLMLGADLVVSLGGQTAYEAMCLGRPVAGVSWGPVARAVAFHARNGLLLDIGECNEVGAGLAHARSAPEQMRQFADSGWARIDGRGAERMAAEVLTVCV